MGYHTYREIRTQVDAWRSAVDAVTASKEEIERLMADAPGREVRFVGAGSSYYLGLSAAVFWGRRGYVSRALPASEQLLHASAYPAGPPPLVVAISRSGATTETLEAARAMRTAGSPCIVLTTEAASEIAAYADVMIEVPGGREESIVQTRSFSGHLVAAQAAAAVAAGDDATMTALRGLDHGFDAWIETADAVTAGLATRFERAYFLGSAERWGLAQEGALKLKEASLSEAEAFHTFEFRHGPKSMIDPATLIVGLLGEAHARAELDVLREAQELGAQVLVVAETLPAEVAVESALFRSGLPEDARTAYYLPVLHLLAYHRSRAKGLDPDHPRHLDFAVRLNQG